METQLRWVVGIALVDSISRLSVPFSSLVFKVLLVRGWRRGGVFAFCGGLSRGG